MGRPTSVLANVPACKAQAQAGPGLASGKAVSQSQGASGIYESLGFMAGGVSTHGQLKSSCLSEPLLESPLTL